MIGQRGPDTFLQFQFWNFLIQLEYDSPFAFIWSNIFLILRYWNKNLRATNRSDQWLLSKTYGCGYNDRLR